MFFKSLADSSLSYKVFLVSEMIVLRCRILAKLGKPETSATLFIVNTHIYVFLFALGLKDYSMNIQDLSNLYNKKIRYNH